MMIIVIRKTHKLFDLFAVSRGRVGGNSSYFGSVGFNSLLEIM